MSHVPKTAACKFISSKLMRHDPADKFPEALPQPVKSDERGFGDLEDQRYLEDEKQANVQIVESLMQRGLSLDEAVRKAYPDYNDKAVDKFKQDYSKSASAGDLCKRAMAFMEKQARSPYEDQGATWGQYFNPLAWGTISRTNKLNRESQRATQRTGTTRAPGKPPEPGDTDYIDPRRLELDRKEYKQRPKQKAPRDVMKGKFKRVKDTAQYEKTNSIRLSAKAANVDWAGKVGDWYEGLSPRYKDLALGGTAGLGVGAIHGLFDDEEDDEGESPSLLRRLGRGLGHGAIGAGIGGLATAGLGAGLDRLNKPGPINTQTPFGPMLDISPPHGSVPISDRLRLGGGPLLNRVRGLRTSISPLAEMWNERALSAASVRR